MHLDWHPGSCKATTAVWPKIDLRRSIQHCRRNLAGNHRRGSKPVNPSAAEPQNLNVRFRPRRGRPRKGKCQPPHMQSRSVWAFLNLQQWLLTVPTRALFHCLMETVLARMRHQWKEQKWCDYLEKEYLEYVRVDPSIWGVEKAWYSQWCGQPITFWFLCPLKNFIAKLNFSERLSERDCDPDARCCMRIGGVDVANLCHHGSHLHQQVNKWPRVQMQR